MKAHICIQYNIYYGGGGVRTGAYLYMHEAIAISL